MAVNISLKGLRCNANYSLEDVATKLGISRETYRKKESGETNLTLAEGFALAEMFGCSINDIREASRL